MTSQAQRVMGRGSLGSVRSRVSASARAAHTGARPTAPSRQGYSTPIPGILRAARCMLSFLSLTMGPEYSPKHQTCFFEKVHCPPLGGTLRTVPGFLPCTHYFVLTDRQMHTHSHMHTHSRHTQSHQNNTLRSSVCHLKSRSIGIYRHTFNHIFSIKTNFAHVTNYSV